MSNLFKILSSSGVEQKIKPISELDTRERERERERERKKEKENGNLHSMTKRNTEIICTCVSISLVIEYRSNLTSVFCMYKAKACKLRISVIIRSWIPGCCTYFMPQKVKLEQKFFFF